MDFTLIGDSKSISRATYPIVLRDNRTIPIERAYYGYIYIRRAYCIIIFFGKCVFEGRSRTSIVATPF